MSLPLFPLNPDAHPSSTDNWRVKRVQAVAALAGESVEEVTIDMAETKKPAFLAKFPMGCVPAFEGADGVFITEAAAIAEHGKHLILPFIPSLSRRAMRTRRSS
jgi:glutathione S-transferase